MQTEWKNIQTGQTAELHSLVSGEIFAAMSDGNKTFCSVAETREFFTKASGWRMA